MYRNRIVSKKMFNPNDILNRVALTACHGGSGTVYQSLAKGVPVLCLPENPDQEFVARTVETQGAGVCLLEEEASSTRIGKVCSEIMDQPGYAIRAGELAKKIRHHDTQSTWLQFLKEFLPLSSSQPDSSALRGAQVYGKTNLPPCQTQAKP